MLAATGVLLILFFAAFAITASVLIGTLEENVRQGMTRTEIEAYLGVRAGTMGSSDEIPVEDRDRFELPERPAPGGIDVYCPHYEPEWLTGLPTAWPLRFTRVFVYYDENQIALELHLRSFL